MSSAQILCTKCGAASQNPCEACPACGGKNSRVCGSCGNQNSIAKNFCDKCGSSIAKLSAAAPPQASIQAKDSEIPMTAVRKILKPAATPKGHPPAARQGAGAAPSLDDLWDESSLRAEPTTGIKPRTSPARTILRALAFLLAVVGCIGGILYLRQSRRPEILVQKLAAEYLTALGGGDHARAYAFFSEPAKANCAESEFKSSTDAAPWTWSELRIIRQEQDAILLSYNLNKPSGSPPRAERLLLAREGDHWTVPFDVTLMRQVAEAFKKGDLAKGTALAQTATEINPRDGAAWRSLCEAAYERRSPEDARNHCLKAIESAQFDPSSLTPKDLYRLHAKLADIYHNSLRQHALALEQLDEMLASPEKSPSEECRIMIERVRIYSEIGRLSEALLNLDKGARLCTSAQDMAAIDALRQTLSASQ